MANLKEIKNRITSVGSTMQITNAMKLVSAAKLKKAQNSITKMRPYAEKQQELLSNLSSNIEGGIGGSYTAVRPVEKVLVVVLTSNRGLCGAFNSNVIKETRTIMEKDFTGKEIDIIAIGKKGKDALKNYPVSMSIHNELLDNPTYENISLLGEKILSDFDLKKYDKVYVVYNKFKNAASQVVVKEQLLPIVLEKSEQAGNKTDYLYMPNKNDIVLNLIPKTIKTQLFKALLDSIASEHGARMTAMHKATDNADSLRKELTLKYNQARQAAITKEILEIVGGAEALAN